MFIFHGYIYIYLICLIYSLSPLSPSLPLEIISLHLSLYCFHFEFSEVTVFTLSSIPIFFTVRFKSLFGNSNNKLPIERISHLLKNIISYAINWQMQRLKFPRNPDAYLNFLDISRLDFQCLIYCCWPNYYKI